MLPVGTIPQPCLTRFAMTPTARLFMVVCEPSDPVQVKKMDYFLSDTIRSFASTS
jgi:hypothetical protein